MVEAPTLNPGVASSNITLSSMFFFHFFGNFFTSRGSRVRFPAGNGHFTAPHGTHETPCTKSSIKFGLGCARWQVAESGGNWSKVGKELLLLSEKI